PNAASFLASPTYVHAFVLSRLASAPMLQEPKAFLFPGFVPLALAAATIWPRRRATERDRRALHAGWTRIARWVEAALAVSTVAAVAITAVGGFRLRVGPATISARQPWRAWVLCAALIAIRVGLARRAPIAIAERVREL